MQLIKEAMLLVISVALLTVYFLLPRNQQWVKVIGSYWQSFSYESRHPDKHERLEYRFGNNYLFSTQVAEQLRRSGSYDTALLLLPPTNYFRARGIAYHVPEPAVFYYYTGLKTVWANSDEAIKANWYLRARGNEFIVEQVTDRKQLQDTINMFKKLGVTL
jgi:hypothetical protein